MNTSNLSKMTRRQSAIVSGIALVLLMFVAIFAYGMVYSTLVIPSDPFGTVANISESYSLFNAGIVGWIAIILLDLIISWTLYVYLRPIHQPLAMGAMLLRLSYVLFLVAGVYNLVMASLAIEPLVGMTVTADAVQVQLVFERVTHFNTFWSIGLIPFGGHLIALGLTAFKSTEIPKILSILLLLAGFSYALIHGLYTFLPQLTSLTKALESGLMIPMTIGELGFGLWLLAKGAKSDSKLDSIAA